ncbi:MAG: SGNH/GDSL hydrolase family protein [Xanthomonadales bacterium]|nr:SGNH/GDSL hydrolase family protein [Xanthomonadales bacterium]
MACQPAPTASRGSGDQKTGALRFLALGDSYTIGEAVPPEGAWPRQLAAALGSAGFRFDPVRIIARTGWTTDELAAAMDQAELGGCYDLVSLSVGVNNQFRGRSVEEYRGQYRDLLSRAIGLADGDVRRVLVLSIPDWSASPFARTTDRDLAAEAAGMRAFNRAMAEETRARGVDWLDITPSTLDMTNDPSLVAEDGLHPSAELYRRWVAQIADSVARRLQSLACP